MLGIDMMICGRWKFCLFPCKLFIEEYDWKVEGFVGVGFGGSIEKGLFEGTFSKSLLVGPYVFPVPI